MPAIDERRREWGAQTRSGWVILFLWQGSKMTIQDIAKLTGLGRRGAQAMMNRLEQDFPIVPIDGKWQWVVKDEL